MKNTPTSLANKNLSFSPIGAIALNGTFLIFVYTYEIIKDNKNQYGTEIINRMACVLAGRGTLRIVGIANGRNRITKASTRIGSNVDLY